MLTVIKDVGLPEPATGSVPIVSGEIAADITNYYAVSEQTPAVCALGVLVNPDLSVRAAGGYLVQLLPGAGEDVISRIEENIRDIKPASTMIDEGMTPEQIIDTVMAGLSPDVLETRTVAYTCTCSKARVERALVSLGRDELRRLAQEQESAQVECHFCDKTYTFTRAELEALINRK